MKEASSERARAFQALLDEAGIKGRVVEFEESTRSAQEAADAIGCELGQIVKSLVFKTKKSRAAVLVLTSGVNRVDEKAIRALVGEKLGKADADFVRESTGYSIGGVPPFGHSGPTQVFIDEDLTQYETIWAAAGTPFAVFPLAPDELIQASGGNVTKVSEGKPNE